MRRASVRIMVLYSLMALLLVVVLVLVGKEIGHHLREIDTHPVDLEQRSRE